MNDRGKRKHRVHVLAFRRGETRAQDELAAHVVTTRRHFEKALKRLDARFGGAYTHSFWVFDEPYWRAHGLAGRPR